MHGNKKTKKESCSKCTDRVDILLYINCFVESLLCFTRRVNLSLHITLQELRVIRQRALWCISVIYHIKKHYTMQVIVFAYYGSIKSDLYNNRLIRGFLNGPLARRKLANRKAFRPHRLPLDSILQIPNLSSLGILSSESDYFPTPQPLL